MTWGSKTERRYGGRTAEQRRSERRERLLDAGHELFATAGYRATTIEGLCAEASLNARYFYEQFRNREELLAAVYERHVQTVLNEVQVAIAADTEAAARLEAGLRAFVAATLADERGARINYFEMVGVSPMLEDLRRGVRRGYADLICDGARDLPKIGARSVAERRMVAVAIVGATDGLISDWLSTEHRPLATCPERVIVDALLAIFAPIVG